MASNTFDPIAICGYSCKLPGSATDAEGLWKMCEDGRSAWTEIPVKRFSQKAFYNGNREEPGTMNVLGGHFLKDDIYAFDASFFNMSIETATSMDPAIRLQLESVFEALENGKEIAYVRILIYSQLEQAGMSLSEVAGTRSSVFSASFHRDYHDSLTRNPDELPRYLLTGTGTAMLSNRISHFFDLRGPSMTIDTGCSSSLTSLHTACRSLQAGDCGMSVVTGCNLMLNPDPFISMSGVGLLSPSGHSYAFDSRAEGYGRGEGVVTLILKTLGRARADGDTVHAIIRGSASNQDGRTATITSPSQEAQEALIKDCYTAAGLDPHQTPFVECHGTGTQVGDVCEVSAVRHTFRTDSRHATPLYLGSVKSNIGHLEAASGLSSIIKVIKAFQHNKIPPNHDFLIPNSSIPWEDWKLAVAPMAIPWPSDFPKRASINSFGYGGANAHIVLDAPDHSLSRVDGHQRVKTQVMEEKLAWLFPLSSNDEQGCNLTISRFRSYLERLRFENVDDEVKVLAALSYKLACKGTHFKWRTVFQASTLAGLVGKLSSKEVKSLQSVTKPSIGFVFTGQGAHWAGMGKELIDLYATFREALNQLDNCLANLGASWSIIDELKRDSSTSRLGQAEFSMPVCCALQIALVVLLKSWNIVPSAVTGHSSGESAAAFATGALDMHSALAVQYYRGLLTSLSHNEAGIEGGMLAVGLGPEEAQRYIENTASGKVVIGCFNSPSSVTLSGDKTGILELEQVLRERGIFVRRLQVQSAFHSHHMERDAHKYRELLESSLSIKREHLSSPLVSSVTGTWLTESDDFGPEHWMKYMLQPVQFTEASRKLCTEKPSSESHFTGQNAVDIIIEIGPHSALSSPLKQTMKSHQITDIAYISMLKRSESAVTTAQDLAGFLWRRGYPVRFETMAYGSQRGKLPAVDLPSYAWNHTTHFAIHHPSEESFRQRLYPRNALIGAIQPLSDPNGPSWRRQCSINGQSWPYELTIDGAAISPLPFFLSMAIEAGKQLLAQSDCVGKSVSSPGVDLENISFNSELRFPSGLVTTVLQTSLYEQQQSHQGEPGSRRAFRVHCIHHPNRWSLLCQGQITINSVDTRLKPVANESNTTRITLDPRSLCDKIDHNAHYGDKPSQITSAGLEITPDSTGLFLRGQWVGGNSTGLDDTSLCLKQLTSALEAAVRFIYIHASGSTKHIPASIKRVIIRARVSEEFSPFYTSNSQIDKDGALAVGWSQSASHDGATTPTTQDIQIQGVTFDAPSTAHKTLPDFSNESASRVHVLSLHHSLANVSNGGMNEIPRYNLNNEDRGMLLDLKMICRMYFHRALDILRTNPPRRLLGHLSSYVQLMKSLEPASTPESQDLSVDDFAALRARVISSSINGLLVCTFGDQLVPIILGEVDPWEVVMKDRLLYRYYEGGPRWTRSSDHLKALVSGLSHEHPRMEVLEIGAGTGGATTCILDGLEIGERNIRCESYTYTDISAGFFPKAKEKFNRYSYAMDFKKLDIERDLKSQSFDGQTYDLIIASHCLHATRNMRRAMANVRKLLRPNGRLIIVEATKNALDIQIFASCFRGWWLSEEPERKTSPYVSIDLWERVLIDTGFSGIDFSVRDCEDDELYTTQVMLSTAVPDLDRTAHCSEHYSDLDLITIEPLNPSITHTLEKHVGKHYAMRIATVEDFDQASTSSSSKMAVGNCKAALLVDIKEPPHGHQEKSLHQFQRELHLSHPHIPVISLRVKSEADMWDQSTLLAISSVSQAAVFGKPSEQHDQEYVLTSKQLYVPRVMALPSLIRSRDMESSGAYKSLKADGQYLIQGRSTGLIIAACQLISSLGARSILTILMGPKERIESDQRKIRQFAEALLLKRGCHVTSTVATSKPKSNSRIVGIIDFGDVEENVYLGSAAKSPTRPTAIARDIVKSVEFYIKLTPLYDPLSVSRLPESIGIVVHTGSIATSDEFRELARKQGSQPIEMHTILLLLANLICEPGLATNKTLYVGLPMSLYSEDREKLVSKSRFRILSLRASERRKDGSSTSPTVMEAAIQSPSYETIMAMSKEEKADTICKGIVGYVADNFMLSASEVDVNGPLTQYIDSLTAVQLRGWLLATFRAGLTSNDIAKAQSIQALAEKVTTRLKPRK